MAAFSTIALAMLAGAGAVNQFAGQRKQAGIIEQEGQYAADIYGQNAALADLQATDAIARGAEAESRYRTQIKGLVGSNRANMAAQGIDVSTGSAVDVQRDVEAVGELDALTIKNNAAREAFGYRVEASQYRRQADLARLGARNQAKALRRASLGSLLTGAANVYGIARPR
jgi:hypothetical protein